MSSSTTAGATADASAGATAGPAAPPTSSGPLQIAPDDQRVWVVNPETDTVSVVEVARDANRLLQSIPTGREPRNLAISPDGTRVFVANSGDDSVWVFDATSYAVLAKIPVGAEPYGLAFTPNGKRLFIANARSNSVSIVDPIAYSVSATISDVGAEPRGIAVTSDGDADDDDEKVYVTQFLGVERPGELIGTDKYKEGRVAVLASTDGRLLKRAVLQPIDDTGFRSRGSVLGGVAAPANATDAPNAATGAFPNLLQAIAIKGTRAYLPNTCPSPDGPVAFNVNVQSCITVLDTTTDQDARQTLNMNRGVQFEVADPADERKRLFHAVPWAIAFKRGANEGWAISLSSNVAIKVALGADGAPTINAPTAAGDQGGIVRVLVGQGPRGIVINGADTRAYVANENSRDLSVIDLASNTVIATVPTAALPSPSTEAAMRLVGKAIFDSSSGVNLPTLTSAQLSGVVPNRRLSDNGWGSCFACHAFGKTDGVTWIFASGPRRSLPLNGTFNPRDPRDQKMLNHSGVFDEVADFELNIRTVSGAPQRAGAPAEQGLILKADGTPDDQVTVSAFGNATSPPLNAGRSAQLDAMAFYVATGIATPRAPVWSLDANAVARGRARFQAANCASCHGGGGWASERATVRPPTLDASEGIAQAIDALRPVGTFDPAAANEKRANGAGALGKLGYVPPSLLGAFALGPYLHNGSAPTLEAVMALVTHRSAGTGGTDTLANPADRGDLVAFLKSIDATTEPFPGP
ncbi:MAG: beta-propeller fold lactonase family protein [Lautropia sp.]